MQVTFSCWILVTVLVFVECGDQKLNSTLQQGAQQSGTKKERSEKLEDSEDAKNIENNNCTKVVTPENESHSSVKISCNVTLPKKESATIHRHKNNNKLLHLSRQKQNGKIEKFSDPVFIPSPEIKLGSPDLDPNLESFRPLKYPLSQDMFAFADATTDSPSERIEVQRESTNYGSNKSSEDFLIKTATDNDVFDKKLTKQKWSEQFPKSQNYDVDRKWQFVESEEDDLEKNYKPEMKIMNFGNIKVAEQIDEEPIRERVPISNAFPYIFEVGSENDGKSFKYPSKTLQDSTEEKDLTQMSEPPSMTYLSEEASIHPGFQSGGKELHKYGSLNSILRILTAIVPLGILLSALTPNVVVINPNATTPSYRASIDSEFYNHRHRSLKPQLMDSFQLGTKFDEKCKKRSICQLLSLKPNENLWKLRNIIFDTFKSSVIETMDSEDNFAELFETARSGQCSKYSCEETSTDN